MTKKNTHPEAYKIFTFKSGNGDGETVRVFNRLNNKVCTNFSMNGKTYVKSLIVQPVIIGANKPEEGDYIYRKPNATEAKSHANKHLSAFIEKNGPFKDRLQKKAFLQGLIKMYETEPVIEKVK